MPNQFRSRNYYKMLREAQRIIKKKNLEIEYRKCLQTIIDQTNELLSKINIDLEGQVNSLESENNLLKWLNNAINENNSLLIKERDIIKSKLQFLEEENELYRNLLSSQRVTKTKTTQL